MISFFLSLGGNIGDRLGYLRRAIEELMQMEGIVIKAISSVYETEPVGFTDQAPFLNIVVQGETKFTARDLLNQILQVEKKLGRQRDIRWGPRTVDIDILLYGPRVIREGDLEIPHPRMNDRAFVLIPLAEIARDCQIPLDNGSFTSPMELLNKVMDKSGVRKWKNNDWVTEFEPFVN